MYFFFEFIRIVHPLENLTINITGSPFFYFILAVYHQLFFYHLVHPLFLEEWHHHHYLNFINYHFKETLSKKVFLHFQQVLNFQELIHILIPTMYHHLDLLNHFIINFK